MVKAKEIQLEIAHSEDNRMSLGRAEADLRRYLQNGIKIQKNSCIWLE